MSKSIANVVIATDSFSTLVTRVNQIADAMTFEVITANGSSSGATTTGNGSIVGIFAANTLSADVLRGGTVNASANLVVSSNLQLTGTTTTVNSNFIANNTSFTVYSTNTILSGSNVNINSTTTVSGTLRIPAIANVTGNVVINNSNTYINVTNTTITGGTLDLSANSITVGANNTTVTANVNINGKLAVGNTISYNAAQFGNNGIYGGQYFVRNANLGATTGTPILIWSYAKENFTLANIYTVAKTLSGGNVQSSHAALLTNGTDAYMTVYATLAAPNTSNVGVLTANTDVSNVNLYYTQTSANSSISLNITLNV